MCNKPCTYRKYIAVNGTDYNCSENPHIILCAKENYNAPFTSLNPSGTALTNLYSTNFHQFYLDLYMSWVNQVQVYQNVNLNGQLTPVFPTITQTGSLFGDVPTLPTNNPLTINETYNSFTFTGSGAVGGLVNYSKPPFDFADNLSAFEYVPAFTYYRGDMGFNTGGDPILLVEFLDVTGKYCQYA